MADGRRGGGTEDRLGCYVICTAPRSGSTLLCRMLRATGVAGAPDSHFHAPSLDGWLDAFGLGRTCFTSEADALRAVLAAALERGRDGGPIFGLRVQGHSLPHLSARLAQLGPDAADDVARMEAAFGPTAFVHLTRRDRLGQAISRLVAEQTGLWHRNADGSESERTAPPRPPRYDPDAIAARMAEHAALDARWLEWFGTHGVTPITLGYEALANDPPAVLGGLLRALGLDASRASSIRPPTLRLADAVSDEWRARFVAERGGTDLA